ncbi:hypothetical protein MMC29_007604 [Sticta canariensis]|nr:hypothetical protein [Sticta canariensis]
MAYNAVAQRDHDESSNFSGSPPLSPRDFYQSIASRNHSSSLVSQPPQSEARSREGSGSMPLRHPTPDLQSLQGSYIKNVERLERSAERLSLSSDIDEELRKMKLEQRISDSRRSSILGQSEERDARPPSSRQLSHGYGSHASNSIVSTNNVARSGGFSPSAYFASPRSSSRSGSWSHNSVKERSTSQVSRLAQMSSSERDGRPLDSMNRGYEHVISPPDTSNTLLRVANTEFTLDNVEIPRPLNISPHKHLDPLSDLPERPPTAASTDTFQHANGLFNDFDGVHIAPPPPPPLDLHENANGETISAGREVPNRTSSFMEPAPTENMVYYPAPVPMMLNLPQRLSKLPAAPQRQRRQSEFLNGLPSNVRKSAPWLPDVVEKDDEESRLMPDDPPAELQNHNRKNMADLPPQLRASVFFNYPTTRQHVEVKGDSAVATLDSILDASAFAPVSAFTDHPIVGHAGAAVYSKPASKFKAGDSIPVEQIDNSKKRSSTNRLKKRNSASDLLAGPKTRNSSLLSLGVQLGRRKSSGRLVSDPVSLDEAATVNLQSEETPLRHLEVEQSREDMADENVEFHDAREEFEAGEEEEQEELNQYSGQPTTLLAELALRKQQQKQRNRTAVTAFPDGMHSTLLELDAVAQVQRQSRKQKHVTLAWEDPTVQPAGVENQDDEDIPLGMLFPQGKLNLRDRTGRIDEDRPLGLIAKRAMEDNEPLSRRRARLRGEDAIQVKVSPDRRASMYTLDIPGFDNTKEQEEPIEIESETLGQRRRRLRDQAATARPRPISGDFANEVMSQFGGLPADPDPVLDAPVLKTPDLEEETLGQRRKRLQAERDAQSSAANGAVNGAANEEVQPAQPALSNRRSMADLLQAHPAAGARSSSYGQQTQWTQEKQRASTNYIAMASRLGMLDPASRGSMPATANSGSPLPYAAPPPGAGLYPNPMVFNAPVPHPVTGLQMGQAPLELDSRQRDMIDRWRQSVMY